MRNPDAAGERFIIAGRWVWAEEIAATLRDAMPEYARVIPKRRVPSWLARLAAKFDPGLKSIIKELDRESPVSHDKAKRILGWTPRSERETIIATAESLVARQIV
jgi:dihydroflavonol-4-reductase